MVMLKLIITKLLTQIKSMIILFTFIHSEYHFSTLSFFQIIITKHYHDYHYHHHQYKRKGKNGKHDEKKERKEEKEKEKNYRLLNEFSVIPIYSFSLISQGAYKKKP